MAQRISYQVLYFPRWYENNGNWIQLRLESFAILSSAYPWDKKLYPIRLQWLFYWCTFHLHKFQFNIEKRASLLNCDCYYIFKAKNTLHLLGSGKQIGWILSLKVTGSLSSNNAMSLSNKNGWKCEWYKICFTPLDTWAVSLVVIKLWSPRCKSKSSIGVSRLFENNALISMVNRAAEVIENLRWPSTHVRTQCAAVKTKFSFIRAPPQKNKSSRAMATCQGNSLTPVSTPPTILLSALSFFISVPGWPTRFSCRRYFFVEPEMELHMED